jgi:hypothetical protein
LLQGHVVTLTLKVATQMLLATRRINMVIISVKYGSCEIRLQITKLWADTILLQGHAVTLTFKVAHPNVTREYGNHFREIVVKSDFK